MAKSLGRALRRLERSKQEEKAVRSGFLERRLKMRAKLKKERAAQRARRVFKVAPSFVSSGKKK